MEPNIKIKFDTNECSSPVGSTSKGYAIQFKHKYLPYPMSGTVLCSRDTNGIYFLKFLQVQKQRYQKIKKIKYIQSTNMSNMNEELVCR